MTTPTLITEPLHTQVYLSPAPSHGLWPVAAGVRSVLGRHDHIVRIAVTGELDAATASVLQDAVVAAARAHRVHSSWAVTPAIELDLSGLRFLDSHGVSALEDTWRALAELGCRLCLTVPAQQVLRLLDLAVVAGWLPAELECVTDHPWPPVAHPMRPRSAILELSQGGPGLVSGRVPSARAGLPVVAQTAAQLPPRCA